MIYKVTDDHHSYARLLLIDFNKAFDYIDHNFLLQKLNINGVHPIIQIWYFNLVQCRQQAKSIHWQILISMEHCERRSATRYLESRTVLIDMLYDFNTAERCVNYVDNFTLVEVPK